MHAEGTEENPCPHNQLEIDRAIVRVTKQSLADARPDDFACLALGVWYEPELTMASVVRRLRVQGVPQCRKRRLLYLLDRLRRYPCLTDDAAKAWKALVAEWRARFPIQSIRSNIIVKDHLSRSWSVYEDASKLFEHVLQYQTRHFVAEHKFRNGF